VGGDSTFLFYHSSLYFLLPTRFVDCAVRGRKEKRKKEEEGERREGEK
jgi:hypothetical protein